MKVILFFIFLITTISAENYQSLHDFKKSNPGIRQDCNQNFLSYSDNEKNMIIVRFNNINTFDFFEFEERYQMRLSFCIANGICAFENLSEQNLEDLVEMFKRKSLFKSVEVYKKYKMKIY